MESSVKNDAISQSLLTGKMFLKLSLTVGPCLDPTASGAGCARNATLGSF